jgi:signal transduction histidine kinase
MDSLFQQISTILSTPPGSLAYHLVLAFSIAGALQISLNHWRNSGYPQGRRMVIGLGGLLLARVGIFLTAGLTWQATDLPLALLPILDRALTTLSLVLIIWLWTFPEPLRLADAATILLIFLTATLVVFTTLWQSSAAGNGAFNGSSADWVWNGLALGVILIGGFLLLSRRPNGWGMGLGIIGLSFVGHLLHLLAPQLNSDYPSAVRLTQLAAYPLLLTLPQRFAPQIQPPKVEKQPLIQERRRYSTDPKVFQSFLMLADRAEPQEIQGVVTRIVSQAMLADLCLLATLSAERGKIIISHGYDLISESVLESDDLNAQQTPLLVTALRRGRPLRLPASSTSAELLALSRALKIERSGPLMAAPLRVSVKDEPQGVILLSPYSNRSWSSEDETHLLNITRALSHLLQHADQIKELEEQLARGRQSAQSLQSQVEQNQRQLLELQTQLNTLEAQPAPSQGEAEGLKEMTAALETAQQTITRLRAENERLARSAAGQPVGTESASKGKNAAVIAAITQDLRQPMSSVLGYADLLLGESVGILGALQRKFLERIKASGERMRDLVGDLFETVSSEAGQVELAPRPVDLSLVIDESIAYAAPQLREKSIALRIDMPEQLPQLHADLEALQQVLVNLLQNAGSVTPPRGEISLRARLERGDDQQDYVFLQVSDMGGGIPPEDLKRLFSRGYRPETMTLRGVGEDGVGLAVAKTLIEAHGGRIWVDTEMGRGSTFSVLLPVSHSSSLPAEQGGGG